MRAIVTICNQSYKPLLLLWLQQIIKITKIPIFVLALEDFNSDFDLDCNLIKATKQGNPFFINQPEYACFEKLRIF